MMDQKDLENHQKLHSLHHRDMPNPRVPHPRRLFVLIISLLIPTYLFFHFLGFPNWAIFTTDSPLSNDRSLISQNNASALVPLEAHVMSKCPDARDCLRDLVVPAMEKIADKVDFRLSFIGT